MNSSRNHVAKQYQGIAGVRIEVGQAVYVGTDGKYYLATTRDYVGVAAESIKAGDTIECDDNGHWWPVRSE